MIERTILSDEFLMPSILTVTIVVRAAEAIQTGGNCPTFPMVKPAACRVIHN
jgi:hypothetical protein